MDRVLLQFLAIAEAGSMSRAAERLRITQPTLTFNLKKLEHTLGVSLFERGSQGMRLTDYGQTLHEHALIMKRLNDNAVASIERQKANQSNGISIGSGYTAWAAFLRDMILEYRTAHPDVTINVSLGNILPLLDQLLAGDVSVCIGHKVPDLDPHLGVDFVPVGKHKDGFFVRAGHPLLSGRRRLTEVRSYPSTIAFNRESHQQRFSSAVFAFATAGHAFTSNALPACLDYVKGTDAVLQHGILLADEFRSQGVFQVALEPGDEPEPITIGIYYLSERSSEGRIISLLDAIRTRARDAYS